MKKVHVCIALVSLITLPLFAGEKSDKCDKAKTCPYAAKAAATCSAKGEGCCAKKAAANAKPACCAKSAKPADKQASAPATPAPKKGAEGLTK